MQRIRKSLIMTFSGLTMAALFLMVLTAVTGTAPTRALTASLSRLDQSDLPPVLLSTAPAAGATWFGEPVVLTFDQPLAASSAEEFSVNPDLAGEVLVDEKILTFMPAESPTPETRYTFTLASRAESVDGVRLAQEVRFSLSAAGPLTVTSTQPADGTGDVDVNTPIVLAFNRPVVPLVGIDAGADLPQPLQLDPPVDGEGLWVNTSIYSFQPTMPLDGGTLYRASVEQLEALDGTALAEPVRFAFTTTLPVVLGSTPDVDLIPPDATFTLRFSQPMDRTSTAAAIALVEDGGRAVDVTLEWLADSTSVTVTPAEWLTYGTGYALTVADSAQPAGGQGNLRAPFVRPYSVVPLPAVSMTAPVDGETGVSTDRTVTIRFNTPLSETTVLPNIHVSSPVTATQVFSYYAVYNNEVTLSWYKEADTTYTVTVGAEIADPFGNTLGEPTVFSFTTGNHPPFTRINLDQFTQFNAASVPTVSAYYRNMETLQASLYTLPLDEFMRLAGPNQYEVWNGYTLPNADDLRIWTRDVEPAVGSNVTGEIYLDIDDGAGNTLPPGLYFLEMNAPPGTADGESDLPPSQPSMQQKVLILSHHNLLLKRSDTGDSLAWLTELATAEPVAGVDVRFTDDTSEFALVSTDEDGLALTDALAGALDPWLPVFAIASAPGDDDFSIVSSNWNEGIGPWEYSINYGLGGPMYTTYFYTDRPIYRPGQTVYWKGIIRHWRDDTPTLPPENTELLITVRDDRGNEVHRYQVSTNAMGTVNGAFLLAPEAVSGFYYLEARFAAAQPEEYGGGVGFQVASYRKPEFELTVEPAAPEVGQGDTVAVTTTARYFSGGPLVDAEVQWGIFASPYTFEWQNAPDGRYFSFRRYDPDDFDFDPYRTSYYGGEVAQGTGVTDGDGRFASETQVNLADSPGSEVWFYNITLRSSTDQFVSGQAEVIAHKSEFYVGLSPVSAVVTAGETATVDLVTLAARGAPDNPPYPGAALDVTVYEFQWNSVYERGAGGAYVWRNEVDRRPVYSTTVTTGRDGFTTVDWTPERGGQYQIEAVGQDEEGAQVSAVTYQWVAGGADDLITWRRENNDRMELVRDRELYLPGETARVLVPNPFMGSAQALITIERGGVLETRLTELTGPSPILEVPITSDHIPNIYLSVVLLKGIDETNPTAAQRIGMVELPVDVGEKVLTVNIEPSAEVVGPASSVDYTLTVVDADGEPVPDAEVSVALVDKAVLSLADSREPEMVDVFYYERPLGVGTSSLLVINQDRLSQQLTEGAKGGGGGDGGMGLIEIREDFADLAEWQAALVSDEEGLIRFTVALPDNLTTWVLVAKAVTEDTKVGQASNEIAATKELQIRAALPRFFTGGDRARIGAVVLNNSEDAAAGSLIMQIQGVTVEQGDLERVFDLAPGAQARFDWTVTVPTDGEGVEVTWTADGGALTDAVRLSIPVQRYTTPETVATAGTVPPEGAVEAVVIPEEAADEGRLEVGVEGSLAAGMLDGLDYLIHYPYECNEQTVSRFLPNLLTVRALREVGMDDPDLAEQLAFQMGVATQRLISRQNGDGGWGYWPGEESSPFITSYVFWGLWQAAQMGYPVAETVLDAAAGYLDRAFVAPGDATSGWQLNEMAFTHFVLAEAGRGDPGRAGTLYDVRERLALYGKAYLAMALDSMREADGEDARIDTLLDDLFVATEYSATGASWHEDGVDHWTLNTDTRTTAIVLAAFVRLDPEQPMLDQAVRWLMSAREAGRWSTTQENAWSLIALTDWLVISRELEGDYEWSLAVNGVETATGVVGPETLSDAQVTTIAVADLLRDQANILRFDRSNGSGQMYYTTELRYYLDALAVDARDRGIVVARRFTDEAGPVASAAVGDVISVTVTIVAPADRHHLLVEVPIPAGTEPIDASLATESDLLAGPSVAAVDDRPFGWWMPSYVDIRDDKVALFATYLTAGTYELTFQVRATTVGEYRVLPVYAEQMYFPDVWGRSRGELFSVVE